MTTGIQWAINMHEATSLEKEMATHSSILAWRIPLTEEPGRLESMGSQRVGHEWGTITHSFKHFAKHFNRHYLTAWTPQETKSKRAQWYRSTRSWQVLISLRSIPINYWPAWLSQCAPGLKLSLQPLQVKLHCNWGLYMGFQQNHK